jgi:nitrogen-specific signal transduction histidine kinase
MGQMPTRSSPKRLSAGRHEASPAAELVRAICHEVGNLLAAARLSAYLLPRTGEKSEGMPEALEDLAAQAGWLLSHVRPLLADDPESRIRVSPSSVLDAVARALRDGHGAVSPPDVQVPEGLPEVRVDSDALHHVLLTLVRSGREAMEGGQEAVVSARRKGGSVVFTVRDSAARVPGRRSPPAAPPRGRALALEIAQALAVRDGGVMTTRRTAGGTEVCLAFPAVPVGRANPRAPRRRPVRMKRS